MRRRKLEREGGVTRISRDNGALLAERLGPPVRVEFRHERGEGQIGPPTYKVRAAYADGSRHDFTGFSWGFAGTGPRGLAEWCRENGVPLTIEEIAGLDGDTLGLVWSFPPWG